MSFFKRDTSTFLFVITGILFLLLLPYHQLMAKEREVYVEGGLRYCSASDGIGQSGMIE